MKFYKTMTSLPLRGVIDAFFSAFPHDVETSTLKHASQSAVRLFLKISRILLQRNFFFSVNDDAAGVKYTVHVVKDYLFRLGQLFCLGVPES